MIARDVRRIFIVCASGFLMLGGALTTSAQPPQGGSSHDPALQGLAARFFAWRAITQPCTPDDIVRVERPDGWVPQVSPDALRDQQKIQGQFRFVLRDLPRNGWNRSDSIDYLLLRSAIERVNWELSVLKTPFRNPDFYTQQTMGAVYELLLLSSPMTDRRAANIVTRIQSIPSTLRFARANLTEPVQPFARLAIANLGDARDRLYRMAAALRPLIAAEYHQALAGAVDSASLAIELFVRELQTRLPSMASGFFPGREAYAYYLRSIALIPMTTGEMLTAGRIEFNRAVLGGSMEARHNAGLPDLPIFQTADQQIEQSRTDELAIRKFLEERDLLTVPAWLQHYRNRLTPPHIAPLTPFGVADDLTSETRLKEDAVSYIPVPSPGLSFFRMASAKDPRPIIIHEGVPGHYFQACISWTNEDPIRRRYIDSGPIEGWGFYVEEMLLQEGLFDIDRTRTRETIFRFMRLRALRVEADIRLAMGELTIPQAGGFLERAVPMDKQTALDEAAFFASTPGQAITYQIGKTQIEAFLSDAVLHRGDRFRIREFHDYIAKNGNVPIALLRWEYLGLRDEIERLWPGEEEAKESKQ